MQNRPSRYNILGAIPVLFQSVMWFLLEVTVSFGILLFLRHILHFTAIPTPAYVGVLLIVLAIGEASRRSITISRSFFLSLLSLRGWLLGRIRLLTRTYSFISLVFLLATLAFAIVAGRLITLGLQSPLTNQPASAQDLFVSVLTIVTAVIAIFFAGAALVVEFIWGAYTSQFVRAFVRHWIFLLSLVLMILIAIANLLPLRLGWNENLATASLASAIYVIVCLGVLVGLLTRFLQAPLIVREVSSQVLAYIRKNLPRPRIAPQRIHDQPRGYKFLGRLKDAFEFYVLGRFPHKPLPVAVPEEFSKGLQEHTHPIFSACFRAIAEDRRDIALACLDSGVTISSAYLEARRNHMLPDDSFMTFLFSQFEMVFNAALQENEQLTADIVKAASAIGQASFLLTESLIRPDTNSVAGMWADFLAKSSLKSLPLRHTSAPVAACEGITQIGQGLLKRGTYTTALYGVAESLKQVGIQASSVRGIWPNVITQRAIWGLVLLLKEVFNLALTESYYQQYATKHLCEALDSITQTAFSQKRGFDTYMTISAPLVGGLWVEGTVVDLFCQVFRALRDRTGRMGYQLVADTMPIVELIHHTGLRVIHCKGPSADYSSALSQMTWSVIQFLENQEADTHLSAGRQILHRVLLAAHSYIKRVMNENPDIMFDHLRHLSPAYGFLVYFAQHHDNQILIDELLTAIEALSSLLPEFAAIDRETAAYRNFHSYIKMFAAWIYKYFSKNPLVSKLLQLLTENAPPEIEFPHFIGSQMERLGYPSGFISENWSIFPSRQWSPDIRQVITEELNDIENYQAFDALFGEAQSN